MAKEKSLQEIQEEIALLEEKKEQYKNKERQLKNREKQLRKMANIQEQKRRTHRLIERGAMLESFIEGASEKSNEEIGEILRKMFSTGGERIVQSGIKD